MDLSEIVGLVTIENLPSRLVVRASRKDQDE